MSHPDCFILEFSRFEPVEVLGHTGSYYGESILPYGYAWQQCDAEAEGHDRVWHTEEDMRDSLGVTPEDLLRWIRNEATSLWNVMVEMLPFLDDGNPITLYVNGRGLELDWSDEVLDDPNGQYNVVGFVVRIQPADSRDAATASGLYDHE